MLWTHEAQRVVFLPQYQRQRKCFFRDQERDTKKAQA